MKSSVPKKTVRNFLELARLVYIDSCAKCVVDVSDFRDLKTIKSRIKREGVSFLTITLPAFCSDFEEALDRKQIDPKHFRGFAKVKAIPELFQGMLGVLFDRESGRFYDNEERLSYHDIPTVIECVRQVCLTFKKVELSCTPAREARAISTFVQTEREFAEFKPSDGDVDYFVNVAFTLWSRLLRDIRLDEMIPRHGPGAVGEKVTSNQKYSWKRWHERLEPYFPFLGNGYSVSSAAPMDDEGYYDIKTREPFVVPEAAGLNRDFEEVSFIKPEDELPSRVALVPKTLKTPRIIAIEPSCMQFVQQAVKEVLYKLLEAKTSLISAGHVNFTDQSINQRLALRASTDGSLATIDLSEASDRVPRSLALRMFDSNPDLRDAIDACRSTRADVPGYGVLPLQKFASMGNALTFPVEAMYFYTICVAALLKKRQLPVTFSNIVGTSDRPGVIQDVFVYGDDLIVPIEETTFVLDYLLKYNCKVNVRKTFVHGNFRESCGVDAFYGYPVTPVYVRRVPPKDKLQATELISWSETAHLFYKKGLWRSASFMYEICERALGESLPFVADDSPGLGRKSFLGYRSVHKWNSRYQRLEVVTWVPEPVYCTDILDDYAALQKSLSTISEFSFTESRDPFSLERSALHGVAALKRRRVPA